MAWDDDYSYNVPDDWPEIEISVFDRFAEVDDRIGNDAFLQGLFDAALFDENLKGNGGPEHDFLMDQLRDYLYDEYDIEFDDVMDWEAWRDWYDSL